MEMMGHAAPFENPSSTAANGLFPCAVVFQMPADIELDINVTAKNLATNNEGTARIAFAVKNPNAHKNQGSHCPERWQQNSYLLCAASATCEVGNRRF